MGAGRELGYGCVERASCALIMYQNKNASSSEMSFSRQLRVKSSLNRCPQFMTALRFCV